LGHDRRIPVKNKRKVEGKLKNLIIIARGSNVACFLTGIACNQNTKKKMGVLTHSEDGKTSSLAKKPEAST